MNALGKSRFTTLIALVCVSSLGVAGVFALRSHLLHAESPRESQIGYSLKHASVAEIETQLKTTLADTGEARVAFDYENNRVLVKGPSHVQTLASHAVAALDQPRLAQAPRQPPESSKAILKAYTIDANRVDALATSLRQAYPPRSGVRIVPDPRTGQLLVVAPPDVHRAIAQRLGSAGRTVEAAPESELTRLPVSSRDPSTHQVQLRHISWRQLESSLNEFLQGNISVRPSPDGQRVSVVLPARDGQEINLEFDVPHGTVTIQGPTTLATAWTEVVQALDKPRRNPDDQTKLVSLRQSSRANVKRALSLLQNGNDDDNENEVAVARLGAAARRPASGALLTRLFQNEEASPDGEAEDNGQARQVAPSADAQQAAQAAIDAATAGGLIGQVQIEYLEGSDVVVIRGHQRDVQRVIEIIQKIEELSRETEPEIQILPLENVDSPSMASLVTDLYEEVYALRRGTVSITALAKPNSLLLIGRPESVKVVVNLVKLLDKPVGPEGQFFVIRLEHIPATEAQTMLQEFFQNLAEEAAAGEEREGLGTKVRVTADVRSNSLIIQASPRDMADVQQLIKQVDVAESRVVSRVEVFQLRNSQADELAPVLQQAISGLSTGTGTGTGGPLPGQIIPTDPGARAGGQSSSQVRSSMLTMSTIDAQGNEQVFKSGIMRDVQINADTATNSLIVTAPDEAMSLISALIQRLDQLPASDAEIKVFKLENGDASDLREMLEELFVLDTTTQTGGPLQTAVPQGETSLVPLRFSVDVRTNSIIVSGSPGDLAVVRAMILRLDNVDQARERKYTVYKLRYTQSQDVAAAIQQYLQAEQQRTQQQIQQFVQGTQQGLSPFEQIEREVVVVAEPLSNSLIIGATPRFFDQILEVIEQIDTIPPMALIQVLIAQISYDQNEEFGVELGIQDTLLFNRGSILGTPGLISQGAITTGNNVAAQGLTDLSMGRTNTELGYGGFVFAAGSENANILIRSLQQRSRVDLLARPQVMTLDNQAARIQVGEDVRIVSGTEITQNGFTNLSTEPRSVGLILDVLPRISPDGKVTMLVSAERSRLGPEDEGTPIGVDQFGNVIRSPNVELTTTLTTVSVQSGQTAVFSGLLTKDTLVITRGVPLLSDIPILGNAFRYDSAESREVELLIILTPHVIRGPEDIERHRAIESSRISWCLADVIRMHGDPGIAGGRGVWHPTEVPTVYPDGNPINMVPTPDEETSDATESSWKDRLLSSLRRRLKRTRPDYPELSPSADSDPMLEDLEADPRMAERPAQSTFGSLDAAPTPDSLDSSSSPFVSGPVPDPRVAEQMQRLPTVR